MRLRIGGLPFTLRSTVTKTIPLQGAKTRGRVPIFEPPVLLTPGRLANRVHATQRAKPKFPFSEGVQCAIPTKPISWFKVLETAVDTENLCKVQESLQNGANLDELVGDRKYCVSTESGDTRTICLGEASILHIAAGSGNAPIVRALLTWGAKLNSRDSSWGLTPLDIACFLGNTEVVKALIDSGAEVDVRSEKCGLTPLQISIICGRFEICELLVRKGAEVNRNNPFSSSTPLTGASYRGDYRIVELLLNSGANLDLRSSSGVTPLYAAVRFPAILQLMLDRGAKVNAQNGPGEHPQVGEHPIRAGAYPIHAAAYHGCIKSVGILLEKGADPTVLDSQGNTPIKLAQRRLDNLLADASEEDEAKIATQQLVKVIHLLEGPTKRALIEKKMRCLFGYEKT